MVSLHSGKVNNTMLERLWPVAIALLLLTGCGEFMTKFAADSTVDVVKKATASFDEESDPWLARHAAIGNLKFIEGIIKASPDNSDLMVIIAKNYALFAFAFLEYDLEELEPMTPEHDALKWRTVNFFNRGRKYSIMRLSQDFEDFHEAIRAKTDDRLDQIMAELDPEDHVPAMYWLAFSWGNMINLQTDEPAMVADLARVKKLMGWVRQHDPDFENAGPVLFFGAIHLALPPALGGKPDEAKKAFEEALERTGGKYLMAKATYARYHSRAVNDRAAYKRLLEEVLLAPDDIMPEQRLANELAKLRARRWLDQIDDFFDEPEGEAAPQKAAPAPADESEDLKVD